MSGLRSTITCPHCGHREEETMPQSSCRFFYDCKGCGVLLRPERGHCCVFCSFGSVPCPPVQEARCRGESGGGRGCRPAGRPEGK